MMRHHPEPVDLDTRAEESNAEARRNARVLFSSSLGALLAACGYYGFTARVSDPLHIYLGIVIMFLAAVPGLLWAKNGGQHLPMFEVYMLVSANTFGLPLLSGHDSLRLYSPELITYAAFTVIVFQASALLTYFSFKARVGRGPFFRDEVLGHELNRYVGYGLTLTSIYTALSVFTDVIPGDLSSILHAVFAGIGLVAVFVQSRRWGLGTLHPGEKTHFAVNLAVQVTLLISTLFLVGGISILVIALLGFVAGSRRLPFIPFAVFMLVIGLLHNGKSAMRERYWDNDGNHRQPALTELPSFFSEWIECGMDARTDRAEKEQTAKLLDRASLFHLLCLVQSQTPDKKPFLDGRTYENLPAQFVPRFFWPGKPSTHEATNQMSVYYGLQRMEDTSRTTIGFGMTIEAYVNFGLFGVIILGVLMGFVYKLVYCRCRESPIMSYAGLFTIVLVAWSFQSEMPLSMWLASMFQACVAIMGMPFVIKNFLG